MKKTLYITCGNIGCGKSTFIKRYVKHNYIIISRDALRYMIGAGTYTFKPELEPAIHESEEIILRSFMKLGVGIVADEVGICKKYREKYIKLAKEYGYRIVCLHFPRLPMKLSVDRRMNNPHDTPDRKVWEMVWNKFNDMYQLPSKKEGFDNIITIKRSKIC